MRHLLDLFQLVLDLLEAQLRTIANLPQLFELLLLLADLRLLLAG